MLLHKSISLHRSVCRVRNQKKICFRDTSFMWFLQQRPRLANIYKDGRLEINWNTTRIGCAPSDVYHLSEQGNGIIMAEYKKYWDILCHTLTINTFKYCFKEVLTVAHLTEELCLTKQRSWGLRGISALNHSSSAEYFQEWELLGTSDKCEE